MCSKCNGVKTVKAVNKNSHIQVKEDVSMHARSHDCNDMGENEEEGHAFAALGKRRDRKNLSDDHAKSSTAFVSEEGKVNG